MAEFLTKFFSLLILSLLLQLNPETASRSLAQYTRGDANKKGVVQAVPGQLPLGEAIALSNFLSFLGSSSEFATCDRSRQPDWLNISIICSSNLPDNKLHVIAITAENAGLNGFISLAVFRLPYLQTLDLSNNKLHDGIPFLLGTLSNLTFLDLSDNKLTGFIPQTLGNLNNLEYLFLHLNFLSGRIPPHLGNLSSLVTLTLWSNNLTGAIPPDLGNLSQLSRLRMHENELNETLPAELGKLTNLKYLWLSSNNLTGKLPQEYKDLKSLLEFEIGGNSLDGEIPDYIADWVHLRDLTLVGNNFQGVLPERIFHMPSLEYLIVSDLNNTGFKFPPSANLKNIFTLMLRNCNIGGEIPSYIGDYSTLRNLDLSFNKLYGGIPDSFFRLKLSRMFLTGNLLSKAIPDWINDTVTLMGDISYNNLEQPAKEIMGLQYNNASNATFPNPMINHVPQDERNYLKQIMDKHCHGKKSKYHSLFINAGGEDKPIGSKHYDADNDTSNTLYVGFPSKHWAYSCVGDFLGTTVDSTDYIQNRTCGISDLESPLYDKARLCPQSLTYYGLCLQKGNYNVKLHFAEVVFTKDEDHSSLGKRVFDIYIQRVQQRRDFNIKEKAGGPNKIHTENFDVDVHDNILEIRLFWAGKGSYSSPARNGPLISAISVTPNFQVGGLSTMEKVGIAIAALLALILLFAFLWRMGWVGDRELRVTHVKIQGKPYTLKQVKAATGNFSTKNEIGQGRFGTVYKAQLPDQKIVAVKKLFLHSKVDQVGTEVYAMKAKQLKHDNLVELFDACSKRDLNLIIYEYMEKGSLKQALLEDPNSKVQIDWQTRISICLGIARGLKYLHEDSSGHIVHRNVKASNVLLDENFNAKVSDLGLAKLYDEENPYKFIQEIGTVVYMAPEYSMRQDITDKVDVYSYGIVLLEILSGKSNSKREDNQNDYLINEASFLHSKNRSLDLVDKDLQGAYDKQQAIKILDLAMKCINLAPALRPTMSEVVNELEQISKVTGPSSSA